MPMSGYDRPTMIRRSRELIALGAKYGVTVISPVIEEKVSGRGALRQTDEVQLYTFWKRDKQIIRNRDGQGAHVVLIDKADKKSLGCEREHGLARYCLWKPVVSVMPKRGYNVATFEDDRIVDSADKAFELIAREYGTQMRRVKWRLRMLARSLPGFLIDQLAAWR